MKRTITLIAFSLLLLFGVSGCSYLTNNHTEYNNNIAQHNLNTRKAYTDALANCQGEPGCLVGVASAYYSNAGQIPFERPETPLAYIRELHPYARLVVDVFGPGAVGKNTGGLNVVGDGNILMDVGNKKSVDRHSVLTDTNSSTYTDIVEMWNRNYNLGSSGEGSVAEEEESVTFTPEEIK